MATPLLVSRLALNRATLARQLLLERVALAPLDAVEHLVGLQAQAPQQPYLALWSRLDPYDPHVLGRHVADGTAARAPLMRTTVHLVSRADALGLRPLMQPVMERTYRTGNPYGRAAGDADEAAVLRAAAALMDERPRTRAELRLALATLFPDHDANALSFGVTYLDNLVQVPPRGVWGRPGQATWARMSTFLDGEPVAYAIDDVVLRYLAAFGPASTMDVQRWCGLTKLTEVTDRLAPGLVRLRDEQGRILYDLPDAPRPDPDVVAQVRFLPEYDNVLLSYADRSRFLLDHRYPPPFGDDGTFYGNVLVDGILRAAWQVRDGALVVQPHDRLTDAESADVRAEAARVAQFHGDGGQPVVLRPPLA